jgi:hypothetical protein
VRLLSAAAVVLIGLTAKGGETLPAGLKVVAIEARPASIELKHRFEYRQLLLTGHLESGETVDLTRMAKLAKPATIVNVSETGLVRAVEDGAEQLVFTFAEHSVPVDVKVSGTQQHYDVSFVRDVQPTFSRLGCNSGTCHGSKNGKNGFKLSLRGYDALFDYRAFTDDLGARRFNRAAPDQSLMLLKATGTIPHVGGVRTAVGSPYYQLLRSWIADGVKFDPVSPRVASIDIYPQNPILPRAAMKQQIAVQATYTDGSVRDVTAEAFIESGNIEVIEAGEGGLLTMLRRGEAPVLVRYEGAYAATTLIVMGDRTGFAWQPPPTNNYIDELVYQKLQHVKILPSDLCTDDEFVRRVFLDLTGLPPTSDQVRSFLDDPRDTRLKRDDLIDRLVGNPQYVEHWTNKWADLLQVNRKFLGEEGAAALRSWIEGNVAANTPYNQFAFELLTASGSNMENPPAAYYKILRDPAELMENTTHLFLAVRFNCNKCHDHPFERWTQDQYYHLASYFAQIGRKEDPAFAGQKIGGSAVEGAAPLVEVIYDTVNGDVTHERTGQVATPAFPYRHGDLAADTASRRQQLARWITSPENTYFARSYVNRLWGYLFGVGIIDPIDDIRAGNPPTNGALLDALTADFVDNGFDAQHMLRTICKSRTYQHSVRTNRWNDDDTINYSHAIPRRLPAEVLYDAIHLATGATSRIPGVPAGFRAAQLPDVGVDVPFLDDFGRPVRESACECERSSGMVLGPIMKLINGPTVAEAIVDPKNALSQLVAREQDDLKLLDELFLRFLARHPSQDELDLGRKTFAAIAEDHQRLVAELAQYEQQLPAKQVEWELSVGDHVHWTLLDAVESKSQAGATFTKQADGALLVTGATGKDVYTLVAHTDLTDITGVRLEALPDPSLPAGGPGRAENGNFVLSELKVTAAPTSTPDPAQVVELANATADFNQIGWHVAGAIDGNESTGWAVSPAFNQPHVAVFETRQDVGKAGGTVLTFALSQQYQDGRHSLGRFRLAVTSSKRPVGIGRLPAELAALLAVPPESRTPQQAAAVADHFRSSDTQLSRLKAQIQQSAEQLKNQRLTGVQDLAWALINGPAFLFNR